MVRAHWPFGPPSAAVAATAVWCLVVIALASFVDLMAVRGLAHPILPPRVVATIIVLGTAAGA
jgi:hypothetical protein